MLKRKPTAKDCVGRPIAVGDKVRIARSLRARGSHPEFRRAFRKVAGRFKTVVGWDRTGGAWVQIRRHEVLTIEPHLLKVIRRHVQSSEQ